MSTLQQPNMNRLGFLVKLEDRIVGRVRATLDPVEYPPPGRLWRLSEDDGDTDTMTVVAEQVLRTSGSPKTVVVTASGVTLTSFSTKHIHDIRHEFPGVSSNRASGTRNLQVAIAEVDFDDAVIIERDAETTP